MCENDCYVFALSLKDKMASFGHFLVGSLNSKTAANTDIVTTNGTTMTTATTTTDVITATTKTTDTTAVTIKIKFESQGSPV